MKNNKIKINKDIEVKKLRLKPAHSDKPLNLS